jgi:tetratricopeptide (TPR) repeat protein
MRVGIMPTLLRRASLLPLAVAAFALTLAAGSPARADDAQAAKEHYQKGSSFYDLGRYPEAIKEFEAAYELKNDPAFLYNLAQAHRLAGNSEQALHFYRTYLRYVPKAPNRAEIEGRISQLEQLVAQKNSAQTTPPNVTIPPGGTTPPNVGTETTPPGTTTPGTTTPPGNTTTMGTTTTPTGPTMLTTAPPPPVPPLDPRAHRYQRIGIGGMIAGGLLVVIGLAEGTRAAGAANEVLTASKNGNAFDPAVEQRGKDAQKAEAVFATLGLVVGGAGAALWYYGHRLEHQVTVMPVASSTGAGASLRVAF